MIMLRWSLILSTLLFLTGCMSPPPPSPTTTDIYHLSLHAKNGLNSWSKSLNKGLCRLELELSMSMAYTKSARTQNSAPMAQVILRDETQQLDFDLAAKYDAESAKILLYLAHESSGGEYLNHTAMLGQAFSLGYTPQPQGDINIEFNKEPIVPAQTAQEELEGPEATKPGSFGHSVTETYHAYPDFNIKTIILQGIGADVEFSNVLIETGCP